MRVAHLIGTLCAFADGCLSCRVYFTVYGEARVVSVEMCRILELQLIINSRMLRNGTVILNYVVLSMLRNCSMNLAV